ncbi:hypothetical protein F8150_21955, partial [Salmonella enterica subsp. enterica serovar Schwarzengrund]
MRKASTDHQRQIFSLHFLSLKFDVYQIRFAKNPIDRLLVESCYYLDIWRIPLCFSNRELSAFSVCQITFYYLTGQALLNLKRIL